MRPNKLLLRQGENSDPGLQISVNDAGVECLSLMAQGKCPYPVGAVFVARVSTNPATLLGFGTWSLIRGEDCWLWERTA